MRKNVNRVDLYGYVFDHNLKEKTVQNATSPNYGKPFIAGELHIATDEEGLNVVTVTYTYVAPTKKNGGENKTYTLLKSILEKNDTWLNVGKENCRIVYAFSSIAVNDFYGRDGTLVSAMRCEGGFLNEINATQMPADIKKRNIFRADFLITKFEEIEANPEKYIDKNYGKLSGYVFNFRNDIVPVTFSVRGEDGINWYLDQDISVSNPCYLTVWGRIKSRTVKTEIETESAWGEASVQYSERRERDWYLTGNNVVPFDFGDEAVLTKEELATAVQNRNVHLAEVKRRNNEYQASRNQTTTSAARDDYESIISDDFKF